LVSAASAASGYGVFFDCGSSGTRVHVYEFPSIGAEADCAGIIDHNTLKEVGSGCVILPAFFEAVFF